MNTLPNGIQAMSRDVEGLVETSLNLGIAATSDNGLRLQFAVRSSVESAKQKLLDSLKDISEKYSAEIEITGVYPGWQYRPESPLRDKLIKVYRSMYGKEPVVEAIHAGLECGFFAEKIEGLDCVSIGPDMYDIHTTSERLSISSVERTYDYICHLLSDKEN